MKDARTTRAELLDLAQELAQTRGLNAFSFQDLARGVGISTASVHHHFPTKTDLAREIACRYREKFRSELASIDRLSSDPRKKLDRFVGLFRKTLRQGNRLCLCGMFATEYTTLPESVQQEVRGFFGETEEWLADVLKEGGRSGVFDMSRPTSVVAKAFLAALEGAMIAARAFGDERRLTQAAKWLLASISAHDPSRAK